MKKSIVASVIAASAAAPLAVALIRTLKTPSKKSAYTPGTEGEELLNAKLSRMIQYDTTSFQGELDPQKYHGFHEVLKELFPSVFETLEMTDIDGNLLFFWKGKNHDKPIVLMSHQDVVPAEGKWNHEPFGGEISQGKIWGRGAADTKCSLMAIFQAVQELLEQGVEPDQDVYISSSCSEEWAGDGCEKLVDFFKERGIRPYMVCDEGGGIIKDPIAGIKGNFAMVGLFEKGKADVRFIARSHGGHASAPEKNSPVDRLAAFVTDVKTHPYFKVELEPEVQAMFENLAPYAPFGMRLLFENLWLFKPLLLKVMPSVSSQAAAMMQTTIAFTTMAGSEACNVIPQEASIGANLRYIPHQPQKETLELLKKLSDKHGLEMEVIQSSDYTSQVDTEGEPYKLFISAIEETFPGLPVSAYVVTGATDCRHYQQISDTCIRFSPVIYGPEQMEGMHGLDENIEANCLRGAVDFYKNLILKNS